MGKPVVRRYRESDQNTWLDLMADLCIDSTAWEAVYLAHPNFHPSFDWVAEQDGRLVGTLGGHLIESESSSFWSAEVFGVHPEHRGLGVGKRLLEESSAKLRATADKMVFWTRSKESRDWYEQKGYVEFDRKSISVLPQEDGELHILKSGLEGNWPLWAFSRSLE